MVLYIDDGKLEGFHPGATSPSYTIPGEHILGFDVEQKVGDIKDTAKVSIDNYQDRYTNLIGHGDRFDIEILGSEIESSEGYGVGGYGTGPYGAGSGRVVWTGYVRNYSTTYNGAGDSYIEISAGDFVSEVMGTRRAYNNFRNRQIVGTNGIINELLESNCPEIDLGQLPDRPEKTSINIFGDYVLDAVGSLALRIPALIGQTGNAIELYHPSTLSAKFELQRKDYGTYSVESNDDGLRTKYRIRGGTDDDIDDQQLTVDGTKTVTDTNLAMTQVETRKSSISRFDLWTRATPTGPDVTVRLQKDEGGAPIAPDDPESDIDSVRLSADELETDGFTEFLFGEHTLPEPRPWVLVQAGDSSGQDIGYNTASGIMGYRVWFPYPIVIVQEDADASAEYRLREGQITQHSINTFQGARDRAVQALRAHSQPTKTLSIDAESTRMHTHDIGEGVAIDSVAASGTFIAMQIKDTYEANQLTTEINFQNLASIQE